jgi:surfeit locus 1 family protein
MRLPLKFNFKNFIYLFILALICLILILLGRWQINRAQQKQSLEQQLHARLQLAPVAVEKLATIDPQTQRFTPVILAGEYLTSYNFLLDNQQHHGKIGYLLLTPFRLAASKKLVLINRGWIARNIQRSELPQINNIAGQITLTGYINQPGTGIALGANIQIESWPQLMQVVDLPLISSKLNNKVENYIVQLTPIDYIGIGSSKHYAYYH